MFESTEVANYLDKNFSTLIASAFWDYWPEVSDWSEWDIEALPDTITASGNIVCAFALVPIEEQAV